MSSMTSKSPGAGDDATGVDWDVAGVGILQDHDTAAPDTTQAEQTGITRQKRWRNENPGKYQAHLSVQRALVRGELVKQPCEVCGAQRVDAHHDDYRFPLDVRWLCRKHHVAHHRAKGGAV